MRRTSFLLLAIAAALFGQQQGQQPGQQQAPPQQQDGVLDEPGKPVARLSVLSGDAGVRRGDSGDWVAAALNAPLMAGDSIAVPPGGAVELQLDGANFARLAGDSELRLLSLDGGRFQLQLSKGLVTYRVLRDSNADPEISTPLVAVHPQRLSSVRVEVNPDGSTRVVVRHGDAAVYTPKGTETIHEGDLMSVRGTQEQPEYQVLAAASPDQWDTWSDQRDGYLLRAQSPRYVSPDIYGAEDLDASGRWSYDPSYGNVWSPNVPDNWAPYRNGQWTWQDSYGWTWVDAAPWGWAPFHYGSWYFRGAGFGWSWFPGSRSSHYWYRPALVGFVGFGRGIGGGLGYGGFGYGNVGWVPLAPFEVYHPWYGRGFGGRVNIVNSVSIHNTDIVNSYRNARVVNGVTAVSANDFQRGNFRSPVAVDRAQLQQGSVVRGGVPVGPGPENYRFSSRAASVPVSSGNPSAQRFYTAGTNPRALSAPQSGFAGTSQGWQRFGSAPTQGQYRGPATSYGASSGGNYSRAVQVTPPIVRQRESAPAYNRGGSGFGAPVYRSAPRSAPAVRSAPAPAARGGGASSGHASPSSSGGHSNSGGHGSGRR